MGGCKAEQRWHPLPGAKRIDSKSCELHWQQPLAPRPPTFPRPAGKARNVFQNLAGLSGVTLWDAGPAPRARKSCSARRQLPWKQFFKMSGSGGKGASANAKGLKSQTALWRNNELIGSLLFSLAQEPLVKVQASCKVSCRFNVLGRSQSLRFLCSYIVYSTHPSEHV